MVRLSIQQEIKYERALVEAKIHPCSHSYLFSEHAGEDLESSEDFCFVCLEHIQVKKGH